MQGVPASLFHPFFFVPPIGLYRASWQLGSVTRVVTRTAIESVAEGIYI